MNASTLFLQRGGLKSAESETVGSLRTYCSPTVSSDKAAM